jgi:hypothetical protein
MKTKQYHTRNNSLNSFSQINILTDVEKAFVLFLLQGWLLKENTILMIVIILIDWFIYC